MEAATNTATATAPKTSDKPDLLADSYSEEEMCAQLDDIGLQTLRRMVDGPPYFKVKRKRRYPIDLAKKWLAKRVRTPRGR
jgi:hypothetical protein